MPNILRTQDNGYTLLLDRHEIDVCRFEDDLRAARSEWAKSSWVTAAQRLREGLAWWSGEPVLAGEPRRPTSS